MGLLRREQKKYSGAAVYAAITQGLENMRRAGVDRVVFHIETSDTLFNISAGWNSDVEPLSFYYPRETHTKAELDAMRQERTHVVYALVLDNTMGMVSYGGDGVEIAARQHRVPYLNKLRRGADLHYVSFTAAWTGQEALSSFAEHAETNGMKPENVAAAVDSGTREYRKITERLWLEALDMRCPRHATTADELLAEMREQISRAA